MTNEGFPFVTVQPGPRGEPLDEAASLDGEMVPREIPTQRSMSPPDKPWAVPWKLVLMVLLFLLESVVLWILMGP